MGDLVNTQDSLIYLARQTAGASDCVDSGVRS